jgi:microcystin-dependent protein
MLTPDVPQRPDVWRVLRCPADVEIEALLNGALSHLLHEYEWDEYGNMTPLETVEMFVGIYRTFREVDLPTVGSFINTIRTLPSEFYLLCDGSTHALIDWPELSPYLPTSWVTGENFTLPNLAGVSFVGTGTNGVFDFDLGVMSGEIEHTLTEAEMPTHTHTYTAPMIADLDFEDIGVPQPAVGMNPLPQNTGSAGSGAAHNNMPPNYPVNVYIVGKQP